MSHVRTSRSLGYGVPNIAPSALGQHYIDLAAKTIYISAGVSSKSDWGNIAATVLDLSSVVGGAPVGLDTIGALAAAINNNPTFLADFNTSLSSKVDASKEAVFNQYVQDKLVLARQNRVSKIKNISAADYMIKEEDIDHWLHVVNPTSSIMRIPAAGWPGNTEITIEAANLGQVRVYPEAGVTLNVLDTFHPVIAGKGGVITIKQVEPNVWTVFGTLLLAEGVTLDAVGPYVEP